MVLSVATEIIPSDTTGNRSRAVRIVAQCLNHYATPGHRVHYIQLIICLWVIFEHYNFVNWIIGADLNWVFSFFRMLGLHSKIFSILMSAYYVIIWKLEGLATSLWRLRCLLRVLIIFTAEFVRDCSCYFTRKLINGNMYWHGRREICNALNRPVLEFVGFGPTMILSSEEGVSFVL